VLEYSRRLWANYTRAFGRADTVGLSVIGDPQHVARIPEVYGDKPPYIFDIHFYGGANGLDEYQLFRAADGTMKRLSGSTSRGSSARPSTTTRSPPLSCALRSPTRRAPSIT
jgi:hypothetical protein